MNTGLMVALDMDDGDEAVELSDDIGHEVAALKVGSQLFTRHGPRIVERIIGSGGKVFLDLKYHDIPNTVAGAVRGASALGVSWLTVHASGGRDMIRAAREAAGDARILAVTVLTSLDRDAVKEIGWNGDIRERVLSLAVMAREAGADGVVCSPLEVSAVRAVVDDHCALVIPGIRPAGTAADDQSRIATPEKAVADGADYLVVGRPIVKAADRKEAVRMILDEMERGSAARGTG
ncbi:MAG: orotidine-5'-phosphate decarboxylase [bacterium]|nr:orotidine-5'-phosphate decarboxylase [bacterium]